MLGEERMITADLPGTTHDSVASRFERRGHPFVLIDTAGIRRRARVNQRIEKFSVVQALKSIDQADVVVLVIDARETITDQDLHLLGLVLDQGRSLVVAVNKWDGLDPDQRGMIVKELDRRLRFAAFAEQKFISALHGTGVGDLFDAVIKAAKSARIDISTAAISELLERAVEAHPPPVVRGRRIKLRYAHLGGHRPPTIIIHGNQTNLVSASYRRYLENFFRDALALIGTPVKIRFKQGDNPYAGKRNTLNARQVQKRRRLMRHSKRR